MPVPYHLDVAASIWTTHTNLLSHNQGGQINSIDVFPSSSAETWDKSHSLWRLQAICLQSCLSEPSSPAPPSSKHFQGYVSACWYVLFLAPLHGWLCLPKISLAFFLETTFLWLPTVWSFPHWVSRLRIRRVTLTICSISVLCGGSL